MLQDLDIFVQRFMPDKVQVYVRVPMPAESGRWSLSGRVRGPFSSRTQTLPSNSTLYAEEPADCLLARAAVIDPCTWSPDYPNLYQVTAELLHDGKVVEVASRDFGLRNLRPQRSDLRFDGQRFVVRGLSQEADEISPWQDLSAVRVTDRFDPSWLEKASQDGVLTIIRAEENSEPDVNWLRQIARHASAAMVVLPNPCSLPDDVRVLVPNLLLAQVWSDDEPLAAWPHACWMKSESMTRRSLSAATLPIPIIAERRGNLASVAEARAACDQLQADLAPIGQFAGYVV